MSEVSGEQTSHPQFVGLELVCAPEIESKLPRLIGGLPVITAESAMVLFGRASESGNLKLVGSGQDGFIVRLSGKGLDWAVKIFGNANDPDSVKIRNSIFKNLGLGNKTIDTINGRIFGNEPSDIQDLTLNQAGGQKLGHAIAPDYIKPPLALISSGGIINGLIMPFVPGKAVPVDIAQITAKDPNFPKALKRLKNGGVSVDLGAPETANAIITDNDDGSKRVTLIDLGLSDNRLLKMAPGELPKGHYYLPMSGLIKKSLPEESPFETTAEPKLVRVMTYSSYKNIMGFGERYFTAHDSGQKESGFTWEDVLEGKVKITHLTLLERAKLAHAEWQDYFHFLRDHSIDVLCPSFSFYSSQEARTLIIGPNDENYLKYRTLKPKQREQSLSINFNHDQNLSRFDFKYRQKTQTGEKYSENSQLGIQRKGQWFEISISEPNGFIRLLKINHSTGDWQFASVKLLPGNNWPPDNKISWEPVHQSQKKQAEREFLAVLKGCEELRPEKVLNWCLSQIAQDSKKKDKDQ